MLGCRGASGAWCMAGPGWRVPPACSRLGTHPGSLWGPVFKITTEQRELKLKSPLGLIIIGRIWMGTPWYPPWSRSHPPALLGPPGKVSSCAGREGVSLY